MKVYSLVILIIILSSCIQQQQATLSPKLPEGILIVNSDRSVEKYMIIQREFEAELSGLKITGINLAEESLQDKLLNTNPFLIYVIGSKAFNQVTTTIQNKPLIFSSMINWRRFNIKNNTYGVALELPAEMQLFMYSYLFPDIRTLGVLYSKSNNNQWFEMATKQAKEVGLSLYGKAVTNSTEIAQKLEQILPKIDALWLISDPIVLHDATEVQKIFATTAASQKPVFAYNTLFTKYGAMLTIAADLPTMGRQAADLAQNIMEQQSITEDDKIQLPAGSHVTLNLKKVREYDISINHSALSSVENIIQ